MSNVTYALVIAFFLFMAGSLFINPIKDTVSSFRTDIGCAAPSSDGIKLLCLGGDAVVPYYILMLFSVIGGIVLSKFTI